ncbi:exopolysaccharide biosynthesis polyprenyl glycosylphosphotransferase [Streptomyces sp. TRM76323]|uniref:Exopolysaccharide biosynthesis polyprenyl glycosylphosphotransferase n=1 Tax=Streptomyces tamarix TaxID=3078565 RepID=A0ABU3QQ26_9ACTN|nr:exopolysaccharide biosynthesis polyprenyl glycosylphosphotransferase [Streptomyces tamarix]MDT9684865.1 exopolysaccharide biosynthesis polyprenyl glycosylphosphotransferase [Streptomyces tamarix]
MTTESTSTSGPHTARPATLAPPRGGTARTAPPRSRAFPEAPFAAALVAADCAAVLPAAVALTPVQRSAALFLQITVAAVALHARGGLYRPAALGAVRAGAYPTLLDELPAVAARLAFLWCAVAALLAARSPELALGPGALAAAYALHLVSAAVLRGAVHHRRRRVARGQPRAALVVGAAPAAHRLAALLHQHPEYGVRPVGLVTHAAQDIPQPADAAPPGPALPVLTSPEDVQRAVIQNGVRDALFVTGEDGTAHPGHAAMLRRNGCALWIVGPTAREEAAPAPMGRHLWGYEFRLLEPPEARAGRLSKRALDIAGAGLLLLAAAPVLLLCAAAVRLADGPGVLFRQERVGENGRLFTLLKFRTLRPENEREAATRWNVAHDERLSPVGSFLRRSSLDELPQLWNVLRGDMSLVGPRPERPYFVERFSRLHAGYAARHRMPVGLTGLAQVHGLRGDTSIEDRCRFDNHYIDHWTLWQDVRILLRTAATLIRPAGG